MDGYEIEFYEKIGGECPVAEFWLNTKKIIYRGEKNEIGRL